MRKLFSTERFQKLIRIYNQTAIVFFSSFFLFLILNLAVFAFQSIKVHWDQNSLDPVSKKYGAALKFVYPQYTLGSLRELLTETWSRKFEYEAFTSFKESQFEGRYVHVDKNGYRYVRGQSPWPPNQSNFNIFVFGGSTTFGYGLSDHETIPSQLQELLRKNTQENIAVYNFGRGYYYSTQERILFEQLLIQGHVPHVAVFIDGVNEMRFADVSHDRPYLYSSFQKVLNASVVESLREFIRQLPLIQPFISEDPIDEEYFKNSLRKPSAEETRQMLRTIFAAARKWMNNKNMIEAIANKYSIKSLFVWQPSPYFKYDLKYHLYYVSGIGKGASDEVMFNIIEDIYHRKFLGDNFLFLADMQESKQEPLYVDGIHYTAKMSKEIASRIVDAMLEKQMISRSLSPYNDVMDQLLNSSADSDVP